MVKPNERFADAFISNSKVPKRDEQRWSFTNCKSATCGCNLRSEQSYIFTVSNETYPAHQRSTSFTVRWTSNISMSFIFMLNDRFGTEPIATSRLECVRMTRDIIGASNPSRSRNEWNISKLMPLWFRFWFANGPVIAGHWFIQSDQIKRGLKLNYCHNDVTTDMFVETAKMFIQFLVNVIYYSAAVLL